MTITTEQLAKLLKNADNTDEMVLLGQTIGSEALKAVLDILGGSQVYIRNYENFCDKLTREVRDKKIYNKWYKGKTQEIADEHGISNERVIQIVKKQSELESSS